MSWLKEIVSQYCEPLLSAAGFAKESMVWNRWISDDLCHVVEIQLGKESTEESTTFTLNFGAFAPKVYEICWGRTLNGFIPESDCIARIRVGGLTSIESLSAAKDIWWTVRSGLGTEAVAKEVSEAIGQLGIPFLNHLRSLTDLRKFLQRTYRHLYFPASLLYLAIVEGLLGNKSSAVALLGEFSRPQLNAWASRAAQVSERLRFDATVPQSSIDDDD